MGWACSRHGNALTTLIKKIRNKEPTRKSRHTLEYVLLSGIYNPYEFEPPHSRGFEITHKDAPQSAGLLWTSDQPVAETST